MKKRLLAITTATIMSLVICTTMSSILPFSIAAEELIPRPNLAMSSFTFTDFPDNMPIYEYTGEIIKPKFEVEIQGLGMKVPEGAYIYSVISSDGDGTSSGVNVGEVTFQIEAIDNDIFYGKAQSTFYICKSDDLTAEDVNIAVDLSNGSFNLDSIVLNKEDCGIRSYTLGDLSDTDEIMSEVSIDGSVLTYSANPNAAGTAEQEIIVSTQNYNDVSVNIHFISEIKSDFLRGDVNSDGVFSVADVILLQKWLLSVPDTHLANWKAADFCEDGKLDVFDLCLMKRDLLDRNKSKLSENSYDFQLLDRYARSNHQGQTNVITQDDEALIIWEIPCFTELIGDVMEVISIDSCTFKEYDGTTGEIKIIQSEDKYNFDKGYSYCIVKALSPGDATLELACKSGSRYVDFVIDDKLNITLKDDKKIYRY